MYGTTNFIVCRNSKLTSKADKSVTSNAINVPSEYTNVTVRLMSVRPSVRIDSKGPEVCRPVLSRSQLSWTTES